MKPIKLKRGERVIAVVPERCSGPGWSNRPTWVYIACNDGKLREECIQPEEMPEGLVHIWNIGATVCAIDRLRSDSD